MALPRAEQDELYSWALQRVRAERSRSGFGGTVDQRALTRAGWQRWQGTGATTHADVVNAVKRAVAANELGRTMTQNPGAADSPVAHDYPHKPVGDARSGRYEYRVVVQARGGGSRVETLIIFQSRNRLSGAEVMEEALREFEQTTALNQSYRGRVGMLGANYTTQAWIVAATRHQPGR